MVRSLPQGSGQGSSWPKVVVDQGAVNEAVEEKNGGHRLATGPNHWRLRTTSICVYLCLWQ